MINQTFLHCFGIGPKTEEKLQSLGFNTWEDCLKNPEMLPFSPNKKDRFLNCISQSINDLNDGNLNHIISQLPQKEHWRILESFYQDATYFDIETTGLSSYDNYTTVISAYRNGELKTFVYGENLDDFLDLVDNSTLLVTFNGNCFDIPFLENSFNIPQINCPYIDLRWICYHQGYSGGLKSIERQLGVPRPKGIAEIDGFEAVRLFHKWQKGDLNSRKKLIKYCQVDSLTVFLISELILQDMGFEIETTPASDLYQKLLN